MKFDVFFSICQAEVGSVIPSEREMFQNFFDQVQVADDLNFGTAWVAESHLSCEVQKQGKSPVIPNFKGEIGLNTDALLLAQKIFQKTKNIEVGSAIRSIFVNGGPMAHAESVKSFLTLHGLEPSEKRKLNLGFAAGRFKFSSEPYGIIPRSAWEEKAWSVIKGKIFLEATEVFLRFLRGEIFSSEDVTKHFISPSDFRNPEDFRQVLEVAIDERAKITSSPDGEQILLPSRWPFARSGVIPQYPPMHLLSLLIGSHDPAAQILANTLMPCGVFNLSITPGEEIERTHTRMQKSYNNGQGGWTRHMMPRTVLVFIDQTQGLSESACRERAKAQADKALRAYWSALEGTIDDARIQKAVENALVGTPKDIATQIRERYHKDDRLMLWFDFFNHNNAEVIRNMELFQKCVISLL